jgi:hypothetical protein
MDLFLLAPGRLKNRTKICSDNRSQMNEPVIRMRADAPSKNRAWQKDEDAHC